MENRPSRPPLDVSVLRDRLVGPDRTWRRLDVVAETGSTNADLLARAEAGEDIDGAVLLAEHQTSGRGRHGRHWLTPPGAQIALSVGVGAERVPTSGWGWLMLAAGVAVADALVEVGVIDAGLKWPNDVVVSDAKLAGILAEVAVPKADPNRVIVVGLGLNVTMTADEAPEALDIPATSLGMLGSAVTDRNMLAEKVLGQLAGRVEAWRTVGGADPTLMDDYRRYSRTLGTRVRASMPGDRQVEGVAEAIDELGRLCIDTGEQTVAVSAGDIAHLRSSG
ncbi:MAG TPA: biotin--[acetyl-CoA-carboxylase] ligase [Mycobacterium sp.]|nr:biotin--[acetyl-CoA-carboxylase] ligase [Mycobacterium sp.]